MARFRQTFLDVFGEQNVYLLDTTCPRGAYRSRQV